MHGRELCVAIAAQRQCVLEGGLRRSREVDSTENARRYGHRGLLQEEGRRGRPPCMEARLAPWAHKSETTINSCTDVAYGRPQDLDEAPTFHNENAGTF
jgi:hypothetical protein